MNEDLLQFVWENLLFAKHDLSTTDGTAIEILESGTIQHGQGPDLEQARIRLDDQLWAGTVEIHKQASAWYEHGHHQDLAYENVILHVVWENDIPARTVSGRKLPTLELKDRISTDSLALHQQLMRNRGWVACAQDLHRVSQSTTEDWTGELLLRRLERKGQLIRDALSNAQFDETEVFYQALLSAFGLKENVEPFSMLGRLLPLSLLRKYRNDPDKVEALLLGVAGMLQTNFIADLPSRLQKEFDHLKRVHELRLIPMASWKFGRIRPANFPTVKLALFAQLISKLDGDLNALLQADSVQELHRHLNVEAREDWQEHYTLDDLSKPSKKRLGKRAREVVIVNAIVPFHFARGRFHGEDSCVKQALNLLEEMPAANDQIVRKWAELGLASETMGQTQALLELKNEFCAAKKCLNCMIGRQLMQKTWA